MHIDISYTICISFVNPVYIIFYVYYIVCVQIWLYRVSTNGGYLFFDNLSAIFFMCVIYQYQEFHHVWILILFNKLPESFYE